MHKNFVASFVCLTICFPRPFRSKICRIHINASKNISTFILDLQLFENNIQQQKPSGLADKKGAHRRVTDCAQAAANKSQCQPEPPPVQSGFSLPCYTTNCVVLPSARKLSSKHRQSPVSCASMDQSPLGNPNCNLLTHKD